MTTADDLTGLPSARAFAAALERQAALARRYDRAGAVVLLATGRADDAGRRAAARALRARLRGSDVVSPVAGARFAVLLAEAGDDDARGVAEDLVALVARATGRPAAAGIACFPAGADRTAGALLRDAGAALAVAGAAPPAVVLFDAQLRRAAGSHAVLRGRRPAGGRLGLERRPVVDVRTGATDHHVLGARLDAPPARRPAEAEPLLHRREVERFVIERALAEAAVVPATLVVPLAEGAALDRAFADWLIDAMGARPLAATRLLIAVPERAAVADLAAVRSLAGRLTEFGARVGLDDFGELGALGLLKALPVRQVRLYPPLVRGLPGSDRDRAIVLALVEAAEALGATPVAPGIASEAEITAVRGFGIGFVDGVCAGGVLL